MEKNEDTLTLRGVIITREALEDRYKCNLTDTEWLIFKSSILRSWKQDEDELRRMVFKHIKNTFENLDFKLKLEGKDLIFKKRL